MVDEELEEGVGFVEFGLYQFWGVGERFFVVVSGGLDGRRGGREMGGWKDGFEKLLVHEVWRTC